MTIEHSDGQAQGAPQYAWISAAINKAGTAAATDITSITAFADLFTPFLKGVTGNARKPYKIIVSSSATLYLKINGGNLITVTATTPFSATDLEINSIFVSDNSANVTATVYLQ